MPHTLIPDLFPVLRRAGLTLRELKAADLPAWLARLADITLAAELVIEFAFETLRLDYIQADVLTTNTASIRALEKLGFEWQQVIENYRTLEGQPCDGFAYRLAADDGG